MNNIDIEKLKFVLDYCGKNLPHPQQNNNIYYNPNLVITDGYYAPATKTYNQLTDEAIKTYSDLLKKAELVRDYEVCVRFIKELTEQLN